MVSPREGFIVRSGNCIAERLLTSSLSGIFDPGRLEHLIQDFRKSWKRYIILEKASVITGRSLYQLSVTSDVAWKTDSVKLSAKACSSLMVQALPPKFLLVGMLMAKQKFRAFET
jgi:hypothetical protein